MPKDAHEFVDAVVAALESSPDSPDTSAWVKAKVAPTFTDTQELETARLIAGNSPDPSTKVGATIINSQGLVCGVGFNCLKPGIKESAAVWSDRAVKLVSVIHAETSAIIDAVTRSGGSRGCAMYVYGLPPCADCARQIINAGIVRVVYKYAKPAHALNKEWRVSCMVALRMLRGAGIKTKRIK